MADVHSPKVRSFNMSKIKSKNTKPELMVRKFLFANGFRYRLHAKNLPGKPDIVLSRFKTVILVNGCFWHGHERCKYFVIPKTRTEWWLTKIKKNKEVDKKNSLSLKQKGWKIINVFACELKPKTIAKTLENLIKNLR